MIADTFFKADEPRAPEENAGEMVARLRADGKLWAQEFNIYAQKLGYQEMDEAWLISWFCNSIMAGYDECANRRRKQIKDLQDLINIQTEPGNCNVNEYMRGMANGFIVAGSCFGLVDDVADALIPAPETSKDAYLNGVEAGKQEVLEDMRFKTIDEINEKYYGITPVSFQWETKSEPTEFKAGDIVKHIEEDSSTIYRVVDVTDEGRIYVEWYQNSILIGGRSLGTFDPETFVMGSAHDVTTFNWVETKAGPISPEKTEIAIGDVVYFKYDSGRIANDVKYTVERIDADGRTTVAWFNGENLHRDDCSFLKNFVKVSD